jgi:hypothetical protein
MPQVGHFGLAGGTMLAEVQQYHFARRSLSDTVDPSEAQAEIGRAATTASYDLRLGRATAAPCHMQERRHAQGD